MAEWIAGAGALGSALQFGGGLIGLGQQNAQFGQALNFARQQLQFQRDAAQMGIRWRVLDSQLAGIHPLVGLGAPTFNPSPNAIGVPSSYNPFEGAGASLAKAGADIGESVMRTRTEKERLEAAAAQNAIVNHNQTRLTDAHVNNLNAQANLANSRAFSTPAFPVAVGPTGLAIPGQAQTGPSSGVGGGINKVPEIPTHNPNGPGYFSGRGFPADAVHWTGNNKLEIQPAPGTPASQGDVFNSTINFFRNRITPMVTPAREITSGPLVDKARERYPEARGVIHDGWGFYTITFPGGDILRPDGSIGPRTGYRK